MNRKKIACMLAGLVIGTGVFTAPVYANAPAATNQTAEAENKTETEDTADTTDTVAQADAGTSADTAVSSTQGNQEKSTPVIDRSGTAGDVQSADNPASDTSKSDDSSSDASSDSSEGSVHTLASGSTSGALTPSGNMTMVDDIGVNDNSKEFITLTTKDGNFFYLIIDRDAKGDSNVHFLNQVDEQDLLSLMDEDTAKEVKQKLEQEKAEASEENTSASGSSAVHTSSSAADQASKESTRPKGSLDGKTIVQGVIGGGLLAVLCGLFFAISHKKKKNGNGNREEEEMEDAYDDAYDLPEEEEDPETGDGPQGHDEKKKE